MTRPRLLDLFCGGGGAATGYARAGFEVVGVDINPQPLYPFEFVQGDVLEYVRLPKWWLGFDAIHASPPCQAYTAAWRLHKQEHPDLLAPTRDALDAAGLPYIIENVVGAPLNSYLELCGTHFGLRIIKHRLFEANWPLPILAPAACDHSDVFDPWHGPGRTAREFGEAQGTEWLPVAGGAGRKKGITGDINNAIPPAYTEWLGTRLLEHLASERKAA